MRKRIPASEIERSWRETCRRTAAMILFAMADSDMGPEEVAARLGKGAAAIRKSLARAIDGQAQDADFALFSDVARAMGFRLKARLEPMPQEEPQP